MVCSNDKQQQGDAVSDCQHIRMHAALLQAMCPRLQRRLPFFLGKSPSPRARKTDATAHLDADVAQVAIVLVKHVLLQQLHGRAGMASI